MADIKISYRGAAIAEINNSGTTTLTTGGYYCDSDIKIVYDKSGGGGGSGIPLLDTITVPADTRAVDLDFSNYTNLNFFLVLADVKLTSSDWLYYVRNGSSPSGGTYDRQSVTHTGLVFLRSKPSIATISDDLTITPQQSVASSVTGSVTNLYIYTYTATKYIKAGSTFKIYGGNYTDL